MAELSTKQREKLKKSDFAYVDKKGNEKLPIHDEEHVRNAISRFNQTDFQSKSAKDEARKKVLEDRVKLIDELRKGQTAPVHMIDQVSRALPEMTWLTNVQQAGYTLTIQGRCLNLTSLSDFIANLEGSRYFMRPVEIIDSQVTDAKTEGPELIAFTIRATFQMAGVDSAPPPPPGAKGAPAAKGGRRG